MSSVNDSRISAIELPPTFEQVEQQALKNLNRLANLSRLEELKKEFLYSLQQPIALKGRMKRALKIADQIAAEVVPHAACQHGCSYCCHMPVLITALEAKVIAEAIGKAPRSSAMPESHEELKHHHRQPCSFLASGKCSIYSVRPMACRLMFNMADTPYFCNTKIDPENSRVTHLNLKDIELPFAATFAETGFADIRDYFPVASSGKVAKRK